MVQLKIIIFLLCFLSTMQIIEGIPFNLFSCYRGSAVKDDDDDLRPKSQPIEQKHWTSVQPVQTILKENVMAVVPVSPVEADKKSEDYYRQYVAKRSVTPVLPDKQELKAIAKQMADKYFNGYMISKDSFSKENNSDAERQVEIFFTYEKTTNMYEEYVNTPALLTDGTPVLLTDSSTPANDLLKLDQGKFDKDLINLDNEDFISDGITNKGTSGIDVLVTGDQTFDLAQTLVPSNPLRTTNPFVDIPEGITNAMAHYDNHNRNNFSSSNNVSYPPGNQQIVIRPSSAELDLTKAESNTKPTDTYVFEKDRFLDLNPLEKPRLLKLKQKEEAKRSMNDEKQFNMKNFQSGTPLPCMGGILAH